jgi:hypothetical protein
MRFGDKTVTLHSWKGKVSVLVPVGVMLLLLLFRTQGAYGWALGWSTPDSANYYGVGSGAMVSGGLSVTGDYVEATTGFNDPSDVWHADHMDDDYSGSSNYLTPYAEYTSSSCGGYCENNFDDCGTLSLGTLYTQEIWWATPEYNWIYSNSGCPYDYALPESSSDGTVDGGSVDMEESDDAFANDFANDAVEVEFAPSLFYATSNAATWYGASDASAFTTLTAPTSSGAVGADYGCSTPWIVIDSSYGGPWSSGSNPGWACGS